MEEHSMSGHTVKKYIFFLILCLGLGCLAGCGKDAGPEEELKEGQYAVYCLDSSGTELVTEVYEAREDGAEVDALVDELLYAMANPKDSANHKSAVPESIVRLERKLNDEVLSVYFTDSYNSLAVSDEVMFRAAYVKTMTQIPGIKYVCFYVNQQPLIDAMGNAVGIMLASDFVGDVGSAVYRTWVDLSIYYAGADGNKLVPEDITVGYGKNASIERVIIDQLIKGPAQEGHLRTVPASLTLLSVSTKDGVCYVNFDSSLTDTVLSVPPAVTIYSIVNSLCELSTVNKVQISVKGESSSMFRDSIDLSQPFERNLDIIEVQ